MGLGDELGIEVRSDLSALMRVLMFQLIKTQSVFLTAGKELFRMSQDGIFLGTSPVFIAQPR